MAEQTKQFELGSPVDHCGMVAVVGKTNVGKSTLVNRLLGEDIAIVSSKVQTTRNLIRGILTEPRGQLVFLDTPGIHQPHHELGKRMNKVARESVDGVDAVLLLFDASQAPAAEDEGWVRRLLFAEVPVLAILNKADTGARHAPAYRSLWSALAEEKEVDKEAVWFEVSALQGQGADDLLTCLFDLAPPGPLLFPPEALSDFPRNLALADLIRAEFLPHLHDELPYALGIAIDELEEGEAGRWHIAATVLVNRSSQKGIVLGPKGRLIKKVERQAARSIEHIYERPVVLKLWVKVEKNWTKNHFLLQRLGYDV